ncbi:MAG: methylated-DNA--[protein]-cysteine S-methyltransferase [Hyphomicrobiaceae bacterium]
MTGPGSQIAESYIMLHAPLGDYGIAWGPNGLTRLQLPAATTAATEERLAASGRRRWSGRLPATVAQVVDELGRYFSGTPTTFADVEVDFGARPPIQLAIYAELRKVAWGETVTYGDLAKAIGMPGAARLIGQTMGRNPVPVIVPCHRVLASGNAIGGFSAPGGTSTKHRLLALERANAIERLPLFAPRA